jgi:hypothetical protein
MAKTKTSTTQQLSASQQQELLTLLQSRFEKNKNRHKDIAWTDVHKRLVAHPDKLWAIFQMEQTGGEPDVVGDDAKEGVFLFYDCAVETPKGRRSTCYDQEGLASRKDFPPEKTAVEMAASMGIELLTEDQYRFLQTLGAFDTKTSSWILTPEPIRKLGGALFCDRRYNHVFTYHNGAGSYYAVRGFRGCVKV